MEGSNIDSESEAGTGDRPGSRGILKKSGTKKSEPQSYIVAHKKPFKLRFAEQRDIGRSNVSSVKPYGLAPTVTPKFYQENNWSEKDEQKIEEIYEKIEKLFSNGPKEKYKYPLQESHEYGWHPKTLFPKDQRTNFGICEGQIVKSRILILSTDQRMGKIKK